MTRTRMLATFVLLVIASLSFIVLLGGNFELRDKHQARFVRGVRDNMNFKDANFSEPPIPTEVMKKVASVSVAASSVEVIGIPVHVIRAGEGTGSNVLLLHGQAFSSATWQELGTVQTLAAMGCSIAAIDLPGYGKTPPSLISNKVEFMEELMSKLSFKPENTVIVSPSLSGRFSLAFLKKHPSLLKGFVPVAPVGTELLGCPSSNASGDAARNMLVTHPTLRNHTPSNLPDLSCYTTPTMVVFGEQDSPGFLQGCALLSTMPRASAQMIPKAGHPAYLDNAHTWHSLLYNFLVALQ